RVERGGLASVATPKEGQIAPIPDDRCPVQWRILLQIPSIQTERAVGHAAMFAEARCPIQRRIVFDQLIAVTMRGGAIQYDKIVEVSPTSGSRLARGLAVAAGLLSRIPTPSSPFQRSRERIGRALHAHANGIICRGA